MLLVVSSPVLHCVRNLVLLYYTVLDISAEDITGLHVDEV